MGREYWRQLATAPWPAGQTARVRTMLLLTRLTTRCGTGRSKMTRSGMSRRTLLQGATALGALVAAAGEPLAQQAASRSAAGPGAPLPPPGEFVIRTATVLTMDPNIGDFGTGDVHVRDGAIIAVEPRI